MKINWIWSLKDGVGGDLFLVTGLLALNYIISLPVCCILLVPDIELLP